MRLPSGSKVGLAMRCSFAWSQHAPRWPAYQQSAAGARGDKVHERAHAIVEGREPSEHEDASGHDRAVSEALARMPQGVRIGERAMAWDASTRAARWLPGNGKRDYRNKRSTEIAMTADVIIAAPDYVHVADWKTGSSWAKGEAAESWQLKINALAAARIHGVDSASAEYVHLDGADHWSDRVHFDAFDLFEIEDALVSLYLEIDSGAATPKPGSHCRGMWCPIVASCPATLETLAVIEADARKHLPVMPAIETAEQAARVHVGLKLIDEARKRWRQELDEYVSAHGPIEIGDGLYYGPVVSERETIAIGHEHLPTLISMMGADAAREAVEVKTSKSAIEDALKSRQAKRGDGVKAARAVVDALREGGAVRSSQWTRYDEFKKAKEIES